MRTCLVLITSLYAERWLTDNWLPDGLTPLMPWWMAIPIANSQAQTFIQWCLWETAEETLILGWWETGTVVIPPLRYTYAHFWLVAGIKPDWVLDSPVWLLVLQEMENLWSLMPAPYVNPVVCVQLCWGGAWSLVPCLCSRDNRPQDYQGNGLQRHLSWWCACEDSESWNEQLSPFPCTIRNCQIKTV